MVVHYFNVPGIAVAPFKAYAPPVVDANTVLSGPVAYQRLQMVGRRDAQVLHGSGNFKLAKFSERRPSTGRKPFYPVMIEKRFGVFATKRLDHAFMLSLAVSIVNQ